MSPMHRTTYPRFGRFNRLKPMWPNQARGFVLVQKPNCMILGKPLERALYGERDGVTEGLRVLESF